MKISKVDVTALSDEVLEHLIFDLPTEELPHCQCALVLGTSEPNTDRTPEAVRRYKSRECDKLVFSGGVYWDTEYGRLTEAEYMCRFAIEHGVPQSDIILDNLAQTTIENMICGALAMHRAFTYISEVKHLMLITSLYHAKRSLLIAQNILPRSMRVHICPAYGSVERSNWKSTEYGRHRVESETGFIKAMAEHGLIPDFDV